MNDVTQSYPSAAIRSITHDLAGEVSPPAHQVIDFAKVRDRIHHLETLCIGKKAASDAFSDAVKTVAEKAGLDKGALASFVAARVGDEQDAEKVRERAEQLELLFSEVGK